MCLSRPKVPAAPPAPPLPEIQDPAAKAMTDRDRKRLIASKGRGSTMLTKSADAAAPAGQKTLLGS